MNRVKPGGYSALIEAAYGVIPAALHELIRPDFLCATDPVFAGLHRYEDATHGRSYRSTAHVAYPHHQLPLSKARRRTTVVLPRVYELPVLVHELGHVLHGSLAWEHVAAPVTVYGATNSLEAFAEAFTSWLIPGYADRPDDRTVAYFDGLVG